MKDLIDRIYFQELARQDPEEVRRRSLCAYDAVNQSYLISIWGDEYHVIPHQNKIHLKNPEVQDTGDYFQLFAVHFLIKSKTIEPYGQWISEKDIPGGTTFFRGPHKIPTERISERFDSRIDDFKDRCENLGGTPLNMADAAYSFEITPRIPVAVLFWDGDDEFPAESKLLFDRSIEKHLALDIIYALAVGICDRLAAPGNCDSGQPERNRPDL